MGAIAARLADIVIVTDDNPREEEPAAIRKAVIEGITPTGLEQRSAEWLNRSEPGEQGYLEIGGRGAAIHAALTHSGEDDIVLIAGKGHEDYQLVGRETRFFDDKLCAEQSSLAWDLETVAAATGGEVARTAAISHFRDISTDTRTIVDNDIFVACRANCSTATNFWITRLKTEPAVWSSPMFNRIIGMSAAFRWQIR